MNISKLITYFKNWLYDILPEEPFCLNMLKPLIYIHHNKCFFISTDLFLIANDICAIE